MAKKSKKISIYLNHNIRQDAEGGGLEEKTSEFILAVKGAGYICFILCYYTGLGLIKAVTVPVIYARRAFGYENRTGLESFYPAPGASKWLLISRVRLRALSSSQFRFALIMFVILIGVSVAGFRSAQLVSQAFELKTQLAGTAQGGLNDLTAGEDLLKNQSADLAGKRFAQAINTFDQTKKELDSVGGFMNGLLNILPQKRDADKLISAVKSLSSVGLELTQFYQHGKDITFGPQGMISTKGASQNLAVMTADLNAALNQLASAKDNLDQVSLSSLPEDKQLVFTQAKEKINAAQTGLNALSDLLKIASYLAQGQKRILLLSENNNELRASGGFIGTYGDIRLDNGAISSMKISSIYDLDGQLKEAITPPRPLWAVNNRWYMRDSNWFFDFPFSVRKITGFYEKEGGETPDLVLAMTPTVMADLLKITGPIDMPTYGVTLNSDNFIEETQLQTSVLYDKQKNQPKQMLADFTPILLKKLSDLPSDQWALALETLQRDLAAKQILLSSRDQTTQDIFSSFNWGGEVRQTDRDYLAVVNSNLGGTKTDLAIDQSVSLSSNIDDDGSITNTLTITRTNPLPADPGLQNLSFMRVYVPKGSTLISTQGFSKMDLPDHLGEGQTVDPDVYAWENSTVKHVVSDTLISEESDKTVFGNWVKTPGQAHQTVILTYRPPFRLASEDHFSLLFQKQPGSVNQHFDYQVSFGKRAVAWKNFDADTRGGVVKLSAQDIVHDIFLGLVFQSK